MSRLPPRSQMPRLLKIALVTLFATSAVLGVMFALLPRPDEGLPLGEALRELGFPELNGVEHRPDGMSLTLVGSVDGQITHVMADPTSAGGLLVALREGRIARMEGSGDAQADFADLSSRVGFEGSEQGLLGLALSPGFADDLRLYVNYTDQTGRTVVARFAYSPQLRTVDAGSEEILLTIDQPYPNHNGGQISFGPDGMLYIATGDGGGGGDPEEVADQLDSHLGKILRIDVSGTTGYQVPPDNPFVGRDDARPEIWAYGLRNPWRFAFDPSQGDLYIADVGQAEWEEVNVLPAGTGPGWHLGWDTVEGFACYEPATGCQTEGLTMPVHTYSHRAGCSITGGVVLPSQYGTLHGNYVFADFCAGTITTLARSSGQWLATLRFVTPLLISTFGFDNEGLVLVGTLSGEVHRLVPAP